ncbi:hypothetical protein BC834DRAFT_665325 [Gloeopeniophorella convolvens]|nr:hypothetical protein BC834DRAFT_665325 [Gloeopeniophorella convolvens]
MASDWHNTRTVLNDYLALIKIDHVFGGLYIWETLLSSGFEFDVFRGKRPYRWTIWLYLGCRLSGLLAFILLFVDHDSGDKVQCQPLEVIVFSLAYLSWTLASLLILLRIYVVTLTTVTWLAGVVINIHYLVGIRAVYDPALNSCKPIETHKGLPNAIAVLFVDTTLLLTKFIGLLRDPDGRMFGLWRLLYQQNIIWLLLATIAELPVLVLVSLNWNDAFNVMLLPPGLSIMSIGGARMYRSLSNYGSFLQYRSSLLDPPPGIVDPSMLRRRNNTCVSFSREVVRRQDSVLSPRTAQTGTGTFESGVTSHGTHISIASSSEKASEHRGAEEV